MTEKIVMENKQFFRNIMFFISLVLFWINKNEWEYM